MEVTGKILRINAEESVGASGFRKRAMHLKTDEQYPQILEIEFVQDKCDILNNFSVNQDVIAHINLRGREWINPEGEAKVFNTLQGWRLETKGF